MASMEGSLLTHLFFSWPQAKHVNRQGWVIGTSLSSFPWLSHSAFPYSRGRSPFVSSTPHRHPGWIPFPCLAWFRSLQVLQAPEIRPSSVSKCFWAADVSWTLKRKQHAYTHSHKALTGQPGHLHKRIYQHKTENGLLGLISHEGSFLDFDSHVEGLSTTCGTLVTVDRW